MSDNFIDTNIIIYSLGDDVDKRQRSIELINNNPVISAQVLNETANVLFKKFSMSVQDIQAIIMRLSKETTVTPLTEDINYLALKIKDKYRFSFYDSLIIASALNAKCKILFSEDMQHEQVIESRLQIINPFL